MIVPQGWEDSKHKGAARTEKFNDGEGNLSKPKMGDACASPWYFYLL